MRNLLLALVLLGCAAQTGRVQPAAEVPVETADWNQDGIRWQGYAEGLAAARRSGKQVLLVIQGTPCPRCPAFSQHFREPEVIELAGRYILVRVDADAEPDTAAMHAPDGTYVPRVFVLTSRGVRKDALQAGEEPSIYLPAEDSAQGLLRVMRAGLGMSP